jgi:hypothetical protein
VRKHFLKLKWDKKWWLSETLWASRADTFSWLLVHYKSLLKCSRNCPVKIQRSDGETAADASSHHAVLLKFDLYPCCSYVTVCIRVHKTYVYPSPVRVLWLSKSPPRGSKSCFAFSGHKGRFPCKVLRSIWAKRFHRK